MKKQVLFSIATAAILAAALSVSASAQTVKESSITPTVDYTPLAVAIEKAGLVYQKAAPGTWVVPVPLSDENEKDEKTPRINVVITANTNNPIVSFNVFVAQIDKPITQEAKEFIMDLNNRYYMAKFGYEIEKDDKGKATGKSTVFIRTDTLMGDITGSTVLSHINILKQIVLKEKTGLAKSFPAPEKKAPAKSEK